MEHLTRRLCAHCGTPFRPRNATHRYHRQSCAQDAARIRRRETRAEAARDAAAAAHRALADQGQLHIHDIDLAGPLNP